MLKIEITAFIKENVFENLQNARNSDQTWK